MPANDLTTLTQVKAWLQAGSTAPPSTDDTLLNGLITSASQSIRNEIGYDPTSQAYTEVRNGSGQTRLALLNNPVTAVASVTISGISIPAAPNPIANGYLFDRTSIYLVGFTFLGGPYYYAQGGTAFFRGQQNVTVVYTAGYGTGGAAPYLDGTVLTHLAQVATDLVTLWYKSKLRIGVDSSGLGPERVSFMTQTPLPAWAQQALNQYKRKFVPV